ncbi:MAG: hypothetical protein AB1757_29605 [Acidobacteriota bacterium]
MKRILTVLIPLALLLSLSTFAQKNSDIDPAPVSPPTDPIMIIQDDTSGNFIVFDQTTGAYKFVQCNSNVILSGLGLVEADGDSLTLIHIQSDRQVIFSCNMATHEGKGSIEIMPLPKLGIKSQVMTVLDSDMTNSSTNCYEKYPGK